MAYVPEDEQEKQNAAANPQIGTGAALPTTGGGGGATPTGMAPNAPTAAPQSASQGFANINQYLGANQGQGAATAGTIASNLGNQYTRLQGDINNAANQASEAIKGGSTAYDPNLVQGALANPSQFVADPNNLAAWQKQYNAAYTGPTAFENSAGYGTAANAANKAAQTAQLGTTGGGYTQLLNQIEKNPTAGRTALDKSLIQADPNAQNTIQGALTPFKGIQDYVSGKSAEIGKQASDAAAATNEAASKTKEAASGAEGSFEQAMKDRLANEQANYTKITDQYKNLMNTPVDWNYIPGTISKGLPGATDQYLNELQTLKGRYGNSTDYEKPFLTFQNNGAPTQEALATPEDYAKSTALGQLSGMNPYLNPQGSNQAGTYKAPQLSLDTEKAEKTVGPALKAADQKAWNIMSPFTQQHWVDYFKNNPNPNPQYKDVQDMMKRLGVLS